MSGEPKPSLQTLLHHDGPSGTVVFLVALPLCLGIALASGAPLFGGIIAGIVGGLVVSFLSGSQVSVSGPAAGLAVIVATAIQELGSYQVFLLAVVLAGILQFLMGVVRLGAVADYIPNCVIKGMLAGIGLVIILKQIPHALGRDTDYEGDFSFLEATGENTLTEIANSVLSANGGAVLISVFSLAVLILWDILAAKGIKAFKTLPGPLVVVVGGILINELFGMVAPAWKIVAPEHLVNLPVSSSFQEFAGNFMSPDFTAIGNQRVWIAAATIAVVASIESLLSLEAADKLDPFRRISPPNRELRAQGVGNLISGLIGGLPITSVVVRTSANVYAGSHTWMSSFAHGVLLLSATLLFPAVLNRTPLASLAAILLVIGYKLTKVDLYRQMRRAGWSQFIPFLVTVLAIVFIDLLTGVMVGLACGLFFVVRINHHEAVTMVNQDNYYLLRFNKDATFVNKSELRTKLRTIPNQSHVVIDANRALFVDHDIEETVEDFRKLASYKSITIELRNF